MLPTNYNRSTLRTTESFEGESIEDKVARTTENNSPIEQISPMYYNERKAGVEAATNIRTDKFDIALEAMESIHQGIRKRRETMKEKAEEPAPGEQ